LQRAFEQYYAMHAATCYALREATCHASLPLFSAFLSALTAASLRASFSAAALTPELFLVLTALINGSFIASIFNLPVLKNGSFAVSILRPRRSPTAALP
jgi:hypothetical protein